MQKRKSILIDENHHQKLKFLSTFKKKTIQFLIEEIIDRNYTVYKEQEKILQDPQWNQEKK